MKKFIDMKLLKEYIKFKIEDIKEDFKDDWTGALLTYGLFSVVGIITVPFLLLFVLCIIKDITVFVLKMFV